MRAWLSASATARTHSAPARVLPKPRPAMISQLRLARLHRPVKAERITLALIESIRNAIPYRVLFLEQPVQQVAHYAPILRSFSRRTSSRMASTLRSMEWRTSAALTLRCWACACAAVSR